MKKILKTIDLISEWTAKIFSFLILPIILLQTVEVLRSAWFSSPTEWTWEVVAILAGAMFIVGGAWVLKEEGHVRTDIVYSILSPKWKAIFDLFFFIIIFTSFAGVLIWTGVGKAIYSTSILERTFSNWAPPLYPLKIIIAASFIMLGAQGVAKMIRDAYFLVKGETL
jgi:TRAP-type mannitol/chloroaromatic compound transport system, small permease component